MTKIFAVVFAVAVSFAVVSGAQARGGCGLGWHRGPGGGCVRNGVGLVVTPSVGVVVAPGADVVIAEPGRACPPGWHLGPYGRRCHRN